MSIYKRGNVWWARYMGPNGMVRESTEQTDKRLAQRFFARRKQQVKDGTWEPIARDRRVTVAGFAEEWIERQHGRGLSTARDLETRMRLHVLPVLGSIALEELRPKHIIAWIDGLRLGELAPRSVHHCYAALRQLCRDAVIREVIHASPCVLPPGTLPKKADADPSWRQGAVFSAGEIETLISDDRIPWDRRVLYALLCLGGLRHGEGAGRRWHDYDATVRPLGRLTVLTQYDGVPLKSELPRTVPVHPTLAAMLAEWRLEGWGLHFGRTPVGRDWIVPSALDRDHHRRVRQTLKDLHRDLEMLGFRLRRTHDLRRTMISLARAGGADRDVLKAITHGQSQDVLDLYTTYPWPTLCEAVAVIDVRRAGKQVHILEHNTKKRDPE